MSKHLTLHPLVFAILCSFNLSAWATTEHQHHHEQVEELAPIVVTAQAVEDTQGVTTTLNPKQATQPIPSADGADYLQSVMGFNAVKNGGSNGDVTFRGMFGSRLKVMTNGTENLGACPGRMDSPTSYISPESYDNITITKGPQTVRYPHSASAVTVNFERTAPQFDDKPYQGQASVMAGSFGRLDHNLDTAIGNDKGYLRLNTNRSTSDDYKDGDGTRVHSSWERWNTDLALGWTPTQNTWLELSAGKADGQSAYAGRNMDGTKFARESLGLRFEQKNVTDVISKIQAQVNYQFNDHVMDNFTLRQPPITGARASNPSRETINAQLAVTHDWNKTQFLTGFDYSENTHQRRMGTGDSYKALPRTTDMKFDSYGWFGELSHQFNPQHKLITGLRFDRAEIDQKLTNQQRTETLPSGFIRLESENKAGDTTTYAGLGYVERIPDYWELRIAPSNNMTRHLMDNLKNEKTLQLDVGYQQQKGNLKSWASAYTGLIHDYILVRYNGTTVNNVENVDAIIAGVEGGLGYTFNDRWNADVSAMYAWGKNTTDNAPLPQIAPLEFRTNLRYVHDRYSLGLLWRAVAQQNRVSLGNGTIVGYDLQKSPSFNTFAINGSYQLTDGVNVSLGIDNLFDKTYTEHLNKAGSMGLGFTSNQQFNETGRNYWARVDFKF